MIHSRLVSVGLFVACVAGFAMVSACAIESDSGDREGTETGSSDLGVDTCEAGACPPENTDTGVDTDTELLDFDVISCNAIDICRACCQAGPCFRACEEVAGLENYELFKAKNDCRYTTCKSACNAGATPCYECWDQECSEEFAACTWNPSGKLTCKQLFDCVNACEKAPSFGSAESCSQSPGLWCHSGCLANGDADATAKFDAYNKCTRDVCATSCQNYGVTQAGTDKCNQCINEKCAAELTSCVEDQRG